MGANWSAEVGGALTGQADFDDVWQRLSAAIDERPGEPGLRRQRIRLAEAACLRCELIADAQALSALLPQAELSDGTQIVTSTSRGRNAFGGGPQVDTLHTDADLPLPLLLDLHRARVALCLAERPGLSAAALRDLDGFVAMQERQRIAKSAFRLAEQPEHFAPMVQAAAQETMRQIAASSA